MFPTFIGLLDIQSWWEVPSIAHFCSLFRAAFNLLDFDIEDLEEALLTDGGAEGRLLQELIVRLLEGCLPNDTRNDISTFNYQMFLRRLFRKKCQEYGRDNPFNTDVDFELLPLRQKVEILRALCDFRLDAKDVEHSLDNLDSDSLRVEPLGHDRKNSVYWYFYGTRLYREDYVIETACEVLPKQEGKSQDKKGKRRGRNRVEQAKKTQEDNEQDSLVYESTSGELLPTDTETIWQVVCFTHQDWSRLVEKFKNSDNNSEQKLYRTLAEDFMPEIPRLFELKEKHQRHRLLQQNSTRVLRRRETSDQAAVAMVRGKAKTKIKGTKQSTTRSSKGTKDAAEVSPPSATAPIPKKGRQTNNSLASAVGQIVIHTEDELACLTGGKVGIRCGGGGGVTSYRPSHYEYGVEEEERQVGMHKVLESLKDHEDAWPFVDPVDEEYAPRYYSVVRRPMDLTKMEEKLEGGSYRSLSQFKRDFRLIVDNCRQYNGSDNEYTEMAVNLKEVFDRAVDRYLDSEPSSDEEPLVPVPLLPASSCPQSSSIASPKPIFPPQNLRKRNRKPVKKTQLTKADKSAHDKDTSLDVRESIQREKDESMALMLKPKKKKELANT